MEPKRCKYRCQNRSKNRCLLKSIFEKILVDFGKENGGKLAPKKDQKSKPPLKRKNQLNTSGLVFSWLSGSQVGSKNRSKIKEKTIPKQKGSETQLWEPSWHAKTEPRRFKIDVEITTIFDQFLKASWNAIFSVKRRRDSPKVCQEGTGPPVLVSPWRNHGLS